MVVDCFIFKTQILSQFSFKQNIILQDPTTALGAIKQKEDMVKQVGFINRLYNL